MITTLEMNPGKHLETLTLPQLKHKRLSVKRSYDKLNRVREFQNRYEKGFNPLSDMGCALDKYRTQLLLLNKEIEKREMQTCNN